MSSAGTTSTSARSTRPTRAAWSPPRQIYKYEIPGGQYSNLLAQVTEMGSKDEFEKIKELYRQANDLLGNLIKVTPTSKVVGDLAIFMLKNG